MTRQQWTNGGILLSGLLLGGALAAWQINFILFFWLTALLVGGWAFPRFRRRAFAADGRAFTAGASAADITASAIWLSASTGVAAHELRHVPGTSQTAGFVALGIAAFSLVLGLWVSRRPLTLSLTSNGVMVRTAFRTRWFPWDGITGPVTAEGQLLEFGAGRRNRIAAGSLTADPWFLGQAIEFYRQHPEHRAAIGTREEHRRWA